MADAGSPPRRRRFTIWATVFGLLTGIPFFGWFSLVVGWFEGGDRVIHRVHDLGYGVLGGIFLAVGFLAQARRPEARVAAMHMVFAAIAGLVVGVVLALDFTLIALGGVVGFVAFAAILVWLHPSREQLFRGGRPSVTMLVLAVAAAVPLVPYALDMARLQRIGSPPDSHVVEHHWTQMAALAVALVLVAVAASLRAPGWRIAAWSAAAGAVVLGLASVLFPENPGSFGATWGAVAIGGGVLFGVVAEVEARRVSGGR